MQATECPPCWFILPESNGPISVGVCKFCGVTKDCSNSGEVTSHFKVAGKVGRDFARDHDGRIRVFGILLRLRRGAGPLRLLVITPTNRARFCFRLCGSATD